jgi:hypothetical protein
MLRHIEAGGYVAHNFTIVCNGSSDVITTMFIYV